ncbi:ABC transporter permease [Uliginosibacterium sp. H3]|uniref:ABC transporter permease n=1 Tax=Uliginosibacterium silvisoli TaxID=3114758 RepID=A0ABU6K3M6_9RHOO|nr:ABC transporter permease [Uliginosibacterium sp. H3]
MPTRVQLLLLGALIRKELTILVRDAHALASLFLMPIIFIVIMSLALKDIYNPPLFGRAYAVDVQDKGPLAAELMKRWVEMHGEPRALPADPTEALRHGDLRYVIRIEEGFSQVVSAPGTPSGVQVHLIADPALEISLFRATEAELSALVGEIRAEALQDRFTGMSTKGGQAIRLLVKTERLTLSLHPTAVQQNVPAWLIFGMFFIVNAIANLLVQENDNGTLSRLLTLGVSPGIQLLSKGLPYLLVNGLQAALMLAVGVWLMPLLGGDGLSLSHIHWGSLLLLLGSLSIAAVGMALALASLIRTHAQASTLGPIINVLMAALGGVMVPRSIMPSAMQTLAGYSPMNWGLEGLMAVLLRHSSPSEIMQPVLSLAGFGAVMLVAAVILFKRRTRQ